MSDAPIIRCHHWDDQWDESTACREIAEPGRTYCAFHLGPDYQAAAVRPDGDSIGVSVDADLADWQPVDLLPAFRGERARPLTTVLTRSDDVTLFPPGIGYVFGDSGDGKSWLTLVAALQLARTGRAVVWLTYEDPNEDDLAERLRLLGADEADLRHLHVIIATEPLRRAPWLIARLCRRVDAALLVLDSVGEALAVDGVNEDRDHEFGPWARSTLREIYDRATDPDWDDAEGTTPCETLTVIPIDHSTKSKDNPHFPSGSKRKRAMWTGLGVSVNVRQPFARDQIGRVQLVCAKDRTGRFRRGEIVAEIVLDATVNPYEVNIDPPAAGTEMSAARKRNATDRILAVLADANVALGVGEVHRIANGDDVKLPGEGDLALGTVRNALQRLTGVLRHKDPTGVGGGYRITYRLEDGQP